MLSRITNIGIRRPLYRSNAATRIFNNGSKRFNTTKANQSSSSSSSSSQQSGSSGTNGKKKTGIKALIQEYGYSALAVYLGLSCIDFPLCFIGVHSVGEDKIHEYQDKFKKMIGITPKERPPKVEGEENKEEESSSIWSSTLFTEAILAYGIHKSLIFIRLPITAAITPAIVGKLRKMGFNIGSQKLSTLAQQAKVKTSQKIVDSRNAVASNKKFGTPVTKRQKWWNWFF